MDRIIDLLSQLNIDYIQFNHPAVFRCEESQRLCPPMPGAHTKQLLMKGKRRGTYVLAIVMHDKRVDTKTLAQHVDEPSFSFASSEDLLRLLGVTPGSVTPFGLIFDTQKIIKVIVDRDAWKIGKFCFHPLVNTATFVIDQQGFQKFFTHTGHAFEVMEIPIKAA